MLLTKLVFSDVFHSHKYFQKQGTNEIILVLVNLFHTHDVAKYPLCASPQVLVWHTKTQKAAMPSLNHVSHADADTNLIQLYHNLLR